MKNYEEYMLLYADRELSNEEEQALLDFVKQHPELEAELKAYAATRLQADTTVVFERKESMLKTEADVTGIWIDKKPKVRSIWIDRRVLAAAASIVLFVVLFAVNRNSDKNITEAPIAKTATVAPAIEETIEPTITPAPETRVEKAKEQEKKFHSKQPVGAVAVRTTKKSQPVGEQKSTRIVEETVNEPIVTNAVPVDTASKEIAVIEEKVVPVIEAKQTPAEVGPPTQQKKNRFIAAIFGEKPQVLGELENALDEKLIAAKNIKDDLKKTELKFQVGNIELLTVRL